ncbi:MAG: hypothetical protein JO000_24780 [Alphaproteobacteria bacterium]|nr:hypothetical protein [Alphaproteobacteria bacterium]
MPIFALPALLVAAAGTTPPESRETNIPFVRSRGVLDWQTSGDDSLYIRGYNGRWYYVRTTNRCPRLRDALILGFVVSAGDRLDRFGAIIAQGMRCPIASVTFAASPPRGHGHRR